MTLRMKQFALAAMTVLLVYAAHAATVDEMLSKFPGQNSAETETACRAIIDSGAKAVAEICGRIEPEASGGKDLAARYALTGLTKYCGAPGRESARVLFSKTVAEAIPKAADASVKAFLTVQLQWTGSDAEVPALATLLDDPATAQPAVSALEAIGTPSAVNALKAKLATATEAVRPCIAKSLDIIGEVPASPVAPLAAKTDGPSGRAIALEKVVWEKGAKALPDLIAAAKDSDAQYRGAALLLAKRIPGKDASAKWAKAACTADDPAVRAGMVAMLAKRDDAVAISAMVTALGDRDESVRQTALETMSGKAAGKGIKVLFRMIEKPASGSEATAAKNALLRAPGNAVADEAAKRYHKQCPCVLADQPEKWHPKQDPPEVRTMWLEILAARGTDEHAQIVAGALEEKDVAVRMAALRALGVIGGVSQVEPVYATFSAAVADDEEALTRETLASMTAKEITARAALADRTAQKLAGATDTDAPRLMRLLNTLGGESAAKAVAAVVVAPTRADAMRLDAVVMLGGWSDLSGLTVCSALLDTLENPLLRLAAIDAVCSQVKRNQTGINFATVVAPVSAKLKNADEKRAFVKGLSPIRLIGAARVVIPFVDDPEIGADASAALADIACMKNDKDKGLGEAEVVAALEKVKAVTKDDALKMRIQAHLDALRQKP